jgi:hypothetical protein
MGVIQKPSLHEVLVGRGVLSEHDLLRALEHQLVYGGRLGTNLVELGHVRLDEIGHLLALQYGVLECGTDELNEVQPAALAQVDRRLCLGRQLIPLRTEGKWLHLVMADPSPEQVVSLSVELSRKIVPYVVPELRLYFYIEELYRVARPGRYLRLPDGGESTFQRRHYLRATVDLPAPRSAAWRSLHEEPFYLETPGGRSESPVMVFAPTRDLDESGDKLSTPAALVTHTADMELQYLDAWQAPGAPRDSEFHIDTSAFEAQETSLASHVPDVLRELAAVDRSPAIAQLLVEPFFAQAQLRILFWVRKSLAVGYRAAGTTRRPERIPALVVDIEKSPLLQAAFSTKDVVCGSAEEDPLQGRMAAYLGAPPPGEVCVVPVLLLGRTIHLLCLHSRAGTSFPRRGLAELRQLSMTATSAYMGLRAVLLRETDGF